ncbi:MFS transporter [Tumebacillus algifaecis]|uniref:MFS transporter n=1 Tax=Tumebacillus algifaecis TaxID=1214604 RepID=UPI0012FDDB48|nr:MFS transporter [Tumebacillus algifaecis]
MFQFLLIGQIVSWLGDDLHQVGMIWFVHEAFGSAYSQAGLGIAMALPMALAALFAGAIVDRFDRSKLLLITDLSRAAISGALVLMLLFMEPNLWVIYAVTALIGLAGLMFNPSVQTLMPEIAGDDKEQLMRMNAWYMSSATVVRVIGPALAGMLLPFISIEWILSIDAVTFLFSAVMVQKMIKQLKSVKNIAPKERAERSSIWKDAWAGLRFLLREPVLGPQFLVLPILEGVMLSMYYLLPILLAANGQNAKLFAILIGFFSLGSVIGITIVRRFGLNNRRGLVFCLNLFLQGAMLIIIGMTTSTWIMVIAFFLMGIPSGAAAISVNTYVQQCIDPQFRGRVFSAIQSVASALIPFCILVMGGLAASYGVGKVLIVAAFVLVAAGVFITSQKAVREAR